MSRHTLSIVLIAGLLGCSSAGLPQPMSYSGDASSQSGDRDDMLRADTEQSRIPSQCGDGTCQPEESCPADCTSDCWTTSCGLRQAACLTKIACWDLRTCIWACPTEACIQRCKDTAGADATANFERYFECGVLAGCDVAECGDGRCRPGETCDEDCARPSSCYGRCGFTFENSKPCQCDTNCSDNNDCCNDYVELCDADAPVCGDGVCDAPAETVLSCTFDCGDATDQCLAAPCKAALTTCYTTPGCPELRACLSDCSQDVTCTSACFANASSAVVDALQDLLACGEQAGCID